MQHGLLSQHDLKGTALGVFANLLHAFNSPARILLGGLGRGAGFIVGIDSHRLATNRCSVPTSVEFLRLPNPTNRDV